MPATLPKLTCGNRPKFFTRHKFKEGDKFLYSFGTMSGREVIELAAQYNVRVSIRTGGHGEVDVLDPNAAVWRDGKWGHWYTAEETRARDAALSNDSSSSAGYGGWGQDE